MPLYTMVTFTHMPYGEALRRGRLQDQILDALMELTESEADWEQPSFQQQAAALLTQLEPCDESLLQGAVPE
jgi:kynurenine 3-monooxygenase